MDEEKIRRLAAYGEQAGEKLRTEFDMDAHRWRRFLVAMARVEGTLDNIANAYEGVAGGTEAFAAFLARYASMPDQYKQPDPERVAAMLKRADQLAGMGQDWRQKPTIREGNIPKPDTDLRISPKP
jgi:hypothetical protein